MSYPTGRECGCASSVDPQDQIRALIEQIHRMTINYDSLAARLAEVERLGEALYYNLGFCTRLTDCKSCPKEPDGCSDIATSDAALAAWERRPS